MPFWSIAAPIIGSVLSAAVAPAIMGGAQYASARATNEANEDMQRRANEFTADQAVKANEFSERMWDKSAAFNKEQWQTSADYNTGRQVAQWNENRELMRLQNEENRYLVNQAIAENRSSADRAMAFEERMSSSAYQRSMADLRKAGLNPILAYAKMGASTPNAPAPTAPTGGVSMGSAAGATLHPPTMGSTGGAMAHSVPVIPALSELGSAMTTALQAYKTAAEIRLLNEQGKSEARRATDAERFGDSALGRGVGSITRILDTGWERVRSLLQTLKEQDFAKDLHRRVQEMNVTTQSDGFRNSAIRGRFPATGQTF